MVIALIYQEMKPIVCLLMLLSFISLSVLGQEEGPLKLEREGLQMNYYYEGVQLEKEEVRVYLSTNPASAITFRTSRNFGIAAVTMAGGAFICALAGIYYMTSSFISFIDCNGRAGDELLRSIYCELAGSAFTLASIACGISYRNNLTRSIKLYNDTMIPQGYLNNVILYFGITENGIGLGIRF